MCSYLFIYNRKITLRSGQKDLITKMSIYRIVWHIIYECFKLLIMNSTTLILLTKKEFEDTISNFLPLDIVSSKSQIGYYAAHCLTTTITV